MAYTDEDLEGNFIGIIKLGLIFGLLAGGYGLLVKFGIAPAGASVPNAFVEEFLRGLFNGIVRFARPSLKVEPIFYMGGFLKG